MRHRWKKTHVEMFGEVTPKYHFKCMQCGVTFGTFNKGPIRITDYQLNHIPAKNSRGMAIREWTGISPDCAEEMAKSVHGS